jgi:hypothetical protein
VFLDVSIDLVLEDNLSVNWTRYGHGSYSLSCKKTEVVSNETDSCSIMSEFVGDVAR